MKFFGNHNNDFTQSCHSLYKSISWTLPARLLARSRFEDKDKTATGQADSGEGLIHIGRRALIRLKGDTGDLPLRAVRIQNRTSGGYLSRFKGRGMEFDEVRLYQPGDDVRTMDWRVTARTGRPHTKIYREEQERAVLLWTDFRVPMHFATCGQFKSVVASRAASMLGWSARNQGDRLGGLAFSETGHREIRPLHGDQGVMNLIANLSDYSKKPVTRSTTLQRRQAAEMAVGRLRRVARPGSLIFLISDFRDLGPRFEQHLTTLSRHNDVVMLYLYDRLETNLPRAGRYQMSNGDKRIEIDTGDGPSRNRYHNRHQLHLDGLKQLCRRHRMHLMSCATDEDPHEVLRQGLGKQK